MNLSKLEWDSDFFGFPVYKLEIDSVCDLDLPSIAGGLQGGICYVIISSAIASSCTSWLEGIGAKYYGSRVMYKAMTEEQDGSGDNEAITISNLSDDVYQLAINSGKCSRFAKDLKFAPKFEALYRKWIENCFIAKSKVRGEIFGIYNNNELVGLEALSKSGDNAKIELLSVAEAHQRKGIGRKLVHAAFVYAMKNNCRSLTVITQGQNESACNLYQSCGFKEVERKVIWHLPL